MGSRYLSDGLPGYDRWKTQTPEEYYGVDEPDIDPEEEEEESKLIPDGLGGEDPEEVDELTVEDCPF